MSASYIPGAEDLEMSKMPFLALGRPVLETVASQRDQNYDRDLIRCHGDPEEGAPDRLGSSAKLQREGTVNSNLKG